MPNTPSHAARLVSPSLRQLVASVLILNLFVIWLAGTAIYVGYHQTLMKARADAQNLSHVLQQNINGSLQQIDAVLYASGLEVERQLASGGIDKKALDDYLSRQHRNVPDADSLRVTNAAGDVLYGSGAQETQTNNLTDRTYFQALRDKAYLPFAISDPIIDRISGKRVIVYARRINNPDGSFGGVIYAPMSTEIIAKAFSSLNLGHKGSVSLRKGFGDFAIIVRYPENIPGTSISAVGNTHHSPQFAALVARGDNNLVYEAVTGVDGIYRTFSVRRLDRFNYFVGLGFAHEDVFVGWRVETVKLLAIASVFLVMSIVMAQQLYRVSRHNKEAFDLLESMALMDGLTGIPNRRRFDEVLEDEWLRARREHQPISLVMVDIDNFKAYNDHYGHGQGDGCLAKVGKALNESVKRPSDLVARYGGEEFVMLLPNTSTNGAHRVAEHARQLIELLRIPHGFSDTSKWITISAGVFTIVPEKDEEASMLLDQTDQLLYKAKQSGRNRICGSRRMDDDAPTT